MVYQVYPVFLIIGINFSNIFTTKNSNTELSKLSIIEDIATYQIAYPENILDSNSSDSWKHSRNHSNFLGKEVKWYQAET